MGAYSKTEGDFMATRYVIVMMFLLIGATFAISTYKDGMPYAMLGLDSREVDGVVTGFEETRSAKKLTYRFVDAEGIGRHGARNFDKDLPLETAEGYPITIAYFPLYPDVAEPVMLLPYLKPAFVIMTICGLAAVVAAIGSVFVVLGWLRRQQEARWY